MLTATPTVAHATPAATTWSVPLTNANSTAVPGKTIPMRAHQRRR